MMYVIKTSNNIRQTFRAANYKPKTQMSSKKHLKPSAKDFDEMSLSAKLGYLEQELDSSDQESRLNDMDIQQSDWPNNQPLQPESHNSSLIRESISQNEKKRELFNQALARTTQRHLPAHNTHSNASLPKSNDSSVVQFQRSPLDFLKENCIKILNKKILKYKSKFSEMRSLIETLKQNKPDSYKKRYKQLRKDFASFLAAQRHKQSQTNQLPLSTSDAPASKIDELSGKMDLIMQMLNKPTGKLQPTVAKCYSYCYLKRAQNPASRSCKPEVHSIESMENEGGEQYNDQYSNQMHEEEVFVKPDSCLIEEASDVFPESQAIDNIEYPSHEIIPVKEQGIHLEQVISICNSVLEAGFDHTKISLSDFKQTIEYFEQMIVECLIDSPEIPIDLDKLVFRDDSIKLEKFYLLKDCSNFQITVHTNTSLFVLKAICLLIVLNFHREIRFELDLTLRFLNSRQQSDYFEFQFQTLKTIIFGGTPDNQITSQDLEQAIASARNNFKLIPFVFNSVFHFMESQLIYKDNSALFDRRSIKSSSKTANFKGACSYVIRMKQLDRVEMDMFTDPNDIWIAFKILFELQATAMMNHKFGTSLRIVFENVKFRNTAQELIAMFAGSELVIVD